MRFLAIANNAACAGLGLGVTKLNLSKKYGLAASFYLHYQRLYAVTIPTIVGVEMDLLEHSIGMAEDGLTDYGTEVRTIEKMLCKIGLAVSRFVQQEARETFAEIVLKGEVVRVIEKNNSSTFLFHYRE